MERQVAEPLPVFDVLIAGGATTGLALAAAIKRALGTGAAVAVVDPSPPPAAGGARPALRTVAIAEGPRRLLESVGAWEAIGPKAQAILSMEIMDGGVRELGASAPSSFQRQARAARPYGLQWRRRRGALGAL